MAESPPPSSSRQRAGPMADRAALRRQLEAARDQARAALAEIEAVVELGLAVVDGGFVDDAEQDVLVGASDRPFLLTPGAFRRMAKEGWFETTRLGGGRIVAWKAHVKAALDARMVAGCPAGPASGDDNTCDEGVAADCPVALASSDDHSCDEGMVEGLPPEAASDQDDLLAEAVAHGKLVAKGDRG